MDATTVHLSFFHYLMKRDVLNIVLGDEERKIKRISKMLMDYYMREFEENDKEGTYICNLYLYSIKRGYKWRIFSFPLSPYIFL